MTEHFLARDVMTRSYATMNENETLSKAIAVFDEKEPDVVVVFDNNGNYKGVLSERWIYRARVDPSKTKIKALARFVPKAGEDEPLVNVAKKMLESNVQAVPVFNDQDVLVGVVSDVDLLFKVVEKEFGGMPAIDVATTSLITLLPNDTVAKALAVFRYNNISRAPVIEEGKVVGIVTMHDIITRFVMPRERARYGDVKGEKIHPLSAPIRKIMSSPVISVTPQSKVREVVSLIKEHGISGVMILDEHGKGVGIVTKRDLIEAFVKHAEVKEKRKILVQLAGDYRDMDEFEMEKIKSDLENFVGKMEKMFDEALVTVKIKKIKDTRKGGGRYIIRMRLIAPGKVYNAHHEGFKALDVMQIVLDKMESEVIADKERRLAAEREKEFLEKHEFWM